MAHNPTAITEAQRTYTLEGHLRALKMDKQFKDEIQKILTNDRLAVRFIRGQEAKKPNFNLLDKAEQERRMSGAAIRRIQQRISRGQYVSCKYSEFTGFIPISAHRHCGRTPDPQRNACLARQLAVLRKEFAEGRLTSNDNDDDDEELVPPCKNQEGNIERDMSGIPQYIEKQRSKSSGHSSDHEAGENRTSDDKTTNVNRQLHNQRAASHSSKRKRANDSDGDDGDEEGAIVWRAVSRGLPLPPGSQVPKFKQPSSMSNPWIGRVVFRGQVPTEDCKDED